MTIYYEIQLPCVWWPLHWDGNRVCFGPTAKGPSTVWTVPRPRYQRDFGIWRVRIALSREWLTCCVACCGEVVQVSRLSKILTMAGGRFWKLELVKLACKWRGHDHEKLAEWLQNVSKLVRSPTCSVPSGVHTRMIVKATNYVSMLRPGSPKQSQCE